MDTVLSIDRSIPFDTVTFFDLDEGWSIEEQDERALVLTEVDFNNVRLEAMLRSGEICVNGEERLKSLKMAGQIRLDAKIFQTLWENQSFIPEKWKEKTNDSTIFISFDGTVLRNPRGDRCVLYLFWSNGQWYWYYHWLDLDFDINYPSAVLAS